MIEDLIEMLLDLFSGAGEVAGDVLASGAPLMLMDPALGRSSLSQRDVTHAAPPEAVAETHDAAAAMDPAKRAEILGRLQLLLRERLGDHPTSPQGEGAGAHDRLLLESLHEHPERAWQEAVDDGDTEELLDTLKIPYARDTDAGKQWLTGFVWANRDAAAWLHDQVAA